MIVTETSPSRSAASNTSKISPRRRLFSALRFSGRFKVMRRTRGRGSSTRTCWYDIGSSAGLFGCPFMPEIGCDVIGAGTGGPTVRLSTPSALPEHAAHQLGGAPHSGLAQHVGTVAFDGA